MQVQVQGLDLGMGLFLGLVRLDLLVEWQCRNGGMNVRVKFDKPSVLIERV